MSFGLSYKEGIIADETSNKNLERRIYFGFCVLHRVFVFGLSQSLESINLNKILIPCFSKSTI
ncbi:hypothetical protein HFN_0091 [Helicobacter fennelliae MRY12-0050]|uniref:Uncharacterized protein n=1 Tax=Helicobacter fennelliae MRY12-0050 TaxID=1325130 RepID=T1CYF1_9HELI|nr:hypothetical protein HFN_0091 [Helicobacter fennelliae MRY12-0050]